jgi:hypothetical protein
MHWIWPGGRDDPAVLRHLLGEMTRLMARLDALRLYHPSAHLSMAVATLEERIGSSEQGEVGSGATVPGS